MFDLPPALGRVYRLALYLGLGFFALGYHAGATNMMEAHTGWKSCHGLVPSAPIPMVLSLSFFVSLALFSVMFAPVLLDTIGPRHTALGGSAMYVAGTIARVFAVSPVAMFSTVMGNILLGLSFALLVPSLAIYLCEIAPAGHRGRLLGVGAMYGAAGTGSAGWVGYAMSFWHGVPGTIFGWRVAGALGIVPIFLLAIALNTIPESPGFLMRTGKTNVARGVMQWARQGEQQADETETELEDSLEECRRSRTVATWGEFFWDSRVRARLWRVALFAFCGSLCGLSAVMWEMPSLVGVETGAPVELQQMVAELEISMRCFFAFVGLILVDRHGRWLCIYGGYGMMANILLYNVLLPIVDKENDLLEVDAARIAMCFLYSLGYSISVLVVTWIIGTELFPGPFRSRGIAVTVSSGSVGSIVWRVLWNGIEKPPQWLFAVAFVAMIVGMLGAIGMWDMRGLWLDVDDEHRPGLMQLPDSVPVRTPDIELGEVQAREHGPEE